MMIKGKRLVLGCTLAAILCMLIPSVAGAIPAFARRYKVSCSTCHAPFPKLKEYGNEFAGNGFVIPEEEKDRDYVSAGDELLWLNRHFPIAMRFDLYGVYEPAYETEHDLQVPWGVKLLSGGALYKNIGYYVYFYLSERGEVDGIEDAYVHFNNIGGREFDVMVGQFQTSDPLMKRELRLTYEDYTIYKTKVGLSGINLAYDRGVMMTYGWPASGTDLVGQIVNGSGIGAADEDTKKFDKDNYKNFGLRISQAVADVLSAGAYFYWGKERLQSAAEDSGGWAPLADDFEKVIVEFDNEVTYWGVDFNIPAGPIEMTAQYLMRHDSRPLYYSEETTGDGRPDVRDKNTSGIIAEFIYAPDLDRSRYYLTLLYNSVDSDLEELDYQTLSFSGTYLLARNLRLTAEYTRDIEYRDNRVVVGVVSAF
ncbi:MAG: hypothetical protein PVH52_00520 [bacterium]